MGDEILHNGGSRPDDVGPGSPGTAPWPVAPGSAPGARPGASCAAPECLDAAPSGTSGRPTLPADASALINPASGPRTRSLRPGRRIRGEDPLGLFAFGASAPSAPSDVERRDLLKGASMPREEKRQLRPITQTRHTLSPPRRRNALMTRETWAAPMGTAGPPRSNPHPACARRSAVLWHPDLRASDNPVSFLCQRSRASWYPIYLCLTGSRPMCERPIGPSFTRGESWLSRVNLFL